MPKAWQGMNWVRQSTRAAIHARDGFACGYCGSAGGRLALDHVLARALGGTNAASNLLTVCIPCNSQKQGLSIRAWFVRLRARGVDTRALGPRVRRRLRTALKRGTRK